MKFKKIWLVMLLLVAVASLSAFYMHTSTAGNFHSEEEKNAIHKMMSNPLVPGEYFLTSEHCRGCHGKDSTGMANVLESGEDVNLFDRWRATMMAQSARDPLWRAKVRQEILTNPAHSAALQDKCTSCHAPTGNYNAHFHGATHYSLNDMFADSLGMDGVTCTACHTMSEQGLGTTFSGHIPYDTTRKIYGPFQFPMAGPMQLYEGYTPEYGIHTEQSRICSSCHTLLTASADLSGNPTGIDFVEQATYHEYLNSDFPANNIQCQTCHMPQLADAIVIANANLALSPRFPFNQHYFAGANHFMLKLMKANRTALNIPVEDYNYDTTLAATERLLGQHSVEMLLTLDSTQNDTAYFKVKLQNKAGHKFPSGYPSRRAVLQFVVRDMNQDTVFKSGTFHQDYRVVGENSQFEPHHGTIRNNDVPQIYEMVMGDVNSQLTTVLERATYMLKDNRIPPTGFSTTHFAYDTVQIVGGALTDPDFNHNGPLEGSGSDIVYFHVPLNGTSGLLNVNASLHYQTVPPKFTDELFTWNDSIINVFHQMYDAADHTPFVVAKDSLTNVLVVGAGKSPSPDVFRFFPSVSHDGKVSIHAGKDGRVLSVKVYDMEGKLILQDNLAEKNKVIHLPDAAGVYLLHMQTGQKTYFGKIVRP